MLSGVLLRDLQVSRGSVFEDLPGDVRLLGSPSGSLALVRESLQGERWIGWGFDFADSDLPLRLAFPQTIINALLWARDGRAVAPPAGDKARLDEPLWIGTDGEEREAVVTDLLRAAAGSRGRDVARASVTTAAGDGPHPYRFARPGLYRVDEGETRSLAVNVFDTRDSDTTRLPAHVGVVLEAPPTADELPTPTPWWVWLCVGAVAVAFLEFGLYTR